MAERCQGQASPSCAWVPEEDLLIANSEPEDLGIVDDRAWLYAEAHQGARSAFGGAASGGLPQPPEKDVYETHCVRAD